QRPSPRATTIGPTSRRCAIASTPTAASPIPTSTGCWAPNNPELVALGLVFRRLLQRVRSGGGLGRLNHGPRVGAFTARLGEPAQPDHRGGAPHQRGALVRGQQPVE